MCLVMDTTMSRTPKTQTSDPYECQNLAPGEAQKDDKGKAQKDDKAFFYLSVNVDSVCRNY